jgi:hypothetical protein
MGEGWLQALPKGRTQFHTRTTDTSRCRATVRTLGDGSCSSVLSAGNALG